MLPNPYVILGALGLWTISLVGVALATRHYVSQGYELRLSQEAMTAQTLLTKETARRLSAEQQQAEANNQIEETRAKAQQDIDAAHDDFERRLALSVRPQRKCAGDSPTGSKAADTASSADNAPGLFIPEPSLRALGADAKLADEWVAYATACHSWAVTVGR